ncbi:MAG: hypothetical protein H6Q14_2737 [Bacteroidetes bacterium]|nr:hypothetical protein [Bacteroidota bacterium]
MPPVKEKNEKTAQLQSKSKRWVANQLQVFKDIEKLRQFKQSHAIHVRYS